MRTILSMIAVLLAFSVAPAHAATEQQNKMATCNKEATGKKGDERKAFMKECLSGGAASAPAAGAATAADAACEKSAADKKLHGAAAKSHIKKCIADAASAPK